MLGSEPEIYFYAKRRAATGHIFVYAMLQNQPFAAAMQDEMIRDLEKARPEYVVFVRDPLSWLRSAGSKVKVLDWWSGGPNSYGAKNYDVVGVIDIVSPERTEYHWDHLESYRPREGLQLIICRRIGK